MGFKDFYGYDKPRSKVVEVVDGDVAFNGAMPRVLSPEERVFLSAKMNVTLHAIRAALAGAKTKVQMTPNGLLGPILTVLTGPFSLLFPNSAPTEVKNNVLNGLRMLENNVNTMLAPKMQNVLDGTLEPERWFNMARTYVDGAKSILNGLDEDSTMNLLGTTWSGIQNDMTAFLARFKAGVERTFDFMPLIAGGAALLGVYLLIDRLAPRRFSEYTRRRRKRIKS